MGCGSVHYINYPILASFQILIQEMDYRGLNLFAAMVATVEEDGLQRFKRRLRNDSIGLSDCIIIVRVMLLHLAEGCYDLFLRKEVIRLTVQKEHRLRCKKKSDVTDIQLLTHRHHCP